METFDDEQATQAALGNVDHVTQNAGTQTRSDPVGRGSDHATKMGLACARYACKPGSMSPQALDPAEWERARYVPRPAGCRSACGSISPADVLLIDDRADNCAAFQAHAGATCDGRPHPLPDRLSEEITECVPDR